MIIIAMQFGDCPTGISQRPPPNAQEIMFLGYNTNGLAHHAPVDAVAMVATWVIAAWGSRLIWLAKSVCNRLRRPGETLAAVAATIFAPHGDRNRRAVLLDPRAKHEPTLVTADASATFARIDFTDERLIWQ